MNTNQLKKFAQATRKKLLEQISAKLEYVLGNETAELRERARVVAQLKEEVKRHGKQQIIDKIAYTWFNRFVALRFMDVNEYQPLGINIVTALTGQVSPQILQDAMAGNIAGELNVDKQKVFGLLDGKIKSANAENDAYRLLLIAACNHLHRIFPFLFEQIDDYTELLLPDDLTSQFSLLHDVVEGLTEEDGKQVECIGWLYQFYISERKDEVFASKEQVKKEDIPAATQLFTPRWIVEYMVQNTVGKLWLMNHPGSGLRKHMPYYIESESVKAQDYLKIKSPEDLTLLDQACGSGHILVYGFELLFRIYEEQGYNANEIPALIIKHNLYGMEIDERAAQLSSLAILMKAREYQPRLFKKTEVPVPNITCYQDLPLNTDVIRTAFASATIKLSDDLLHDLDKMRQSTNLGSLITPHTRQNELVQVNEQIIRAIPVANLYNRLNLEEIAKAINTLVRLSAKYCCVVDNPPYMGGGKMNSELSQFVNKEYPESKADLMTCFIQSSANILKKNGLFGAVTLDSWMFLSSFEKLREKILSEQFIDNLIHIGWNCFPHGHVYNRGVAFILLNSSNNKYRGSYLNLSNTPAVVDKNQLFKARIISKEFYYLRFQEDFKKIPGIPFAFWLSNKILSIFISSKKLGSISNPVKGLDTCDNNRFVRYWYEVNVDNIGINVLNTNDTYNKTWYFYNKGGEYRKWYGNNEKVVNWFEDGKELRNFRDEDGRIKSRPQNVQYYFKDGATWSSVTSSKLSVRLLDKSIFGGGGSAIFPRENIPYIIGFLNSKVVGAILELLNPTLNFLVGDFSKLPISYPSFESKVSIENIISNSIGIAKSDWNKTEFSIGFAKTEFIRINGHDIEETYDLYQQYWKNKFYQLHNNEEDINRQFIEIYGLQDELTPAVPLEDITILKQETSIENGTLVFNASEVFAQYLSYSVGCMFGRYSLDAEGLILASQGETMKDYFEKTGSDKSSTSFLPDEDNIIPVLDDEWFDDDIVASFYKFLKVTFGEKNFRKNLDFIEEQLGKDIRKYFVKDFYTDHLQRYKKRPIYWMFSSPKGHFNVLVYLHRYTPDTLNNILNNYLREFIEKLKTRTEHLKEVEVKGSAAEKTKAGKEIERIKIMLTDCLDYERNILYPLAAERIAIDLDNGVLVNYNCFGKAVKEVKGLNDTKTKNEVRKFDWIDTAMIQ